MEILIYFSITQSLSNLSNSLARGYLEKQYSSVSILNNSANPVTAQ